MNEKNLTPELAELVKMKILEDLLKYEEISNVIANATITVLGNLGIEENKLMKQLESLKKKHSKLVKEYYDVQYALQNACNDPKCNPKKLESYYELLETIREKRISIMNQIKETEMNLQKIKINVEGGEQLQKLLEHDYEKLVKKIEHAKKNFPGIFRDVQQDISTLQLLKRRMLDS